LIFVDTSAFYALADRADARHREAVELFDAILSKREILLTHNYVLLEAMALLQHRLGTAACLKLARSAASFDIVWVDRALHENAVRRLERAGKRRVSLVDHVSFLVMRERSVDQAFAFDPDFETEGFRLVSP
jgi:predicted nucleic acid-binding protein